VKAASTTAMDLDRKLAAASEGGRRARLQVETDEIVRAHFAGDLLELDGKSADGLARSTLATLKGLEARMWLSWALATKDDLAGYSDIVSGLASSSSRLHTMAAQHLIAVANACRPCDLKPQPLNLALGMLGDSAAAVRLAAVIAVAAHLSDDPRCETALAKVAETDEAPIVRTTATSFLQPFLQKRHHGGSLP
jgi:hypothetical protein